MDESPKQLIKETRIGIAMKPGSDEKIDFEYERCGVANIFLASEPLKGKRYVEVTERKTKADNFGCRLNTQTLVTRRHRTGVRRLMGQQRQPKK